MNDTERITQGDLPHWYKPGYAHFITYQLANTIPWSRLKKWRSERQHLVEQPPRAGLTRREHRELAHKQFFSRYDDYLDRHVKVRWLVQPAIATMVRENLYHHHGSLYELISWCIMPTHVHVLLQPFEHAGNSTEADAGSVGHGVYSDEVIDSRSPLSRIMHSLKSYTANRANELLRRQGGFWQKESYDHWIRDLDELSNIVDYIRLNPVRAGLCQEAHRYQYSSAYDRFLRDESTCGLVGWLRDDWRR